MSRQSIEKQHNIQPPAMLLTVLDFFHYAQDVGLVLGDPLGFQGARWTEKAQRKIDSRDDFDALPQHVQ